MSDSPSTLSYADADPGSDFFGEAEQPDELTLFDRIVRALTWGTLSICLAVWALAGAVFWLPTMVRAVAVFSLSLVEATMKGERPEDAARALREAVTFYSRGFATAVEVVTRAPEEERGRRRAEARKRSVDFSRLAREALWALILWYLVLWIVGAVEASPVELWMTFWTFPWLELGSSLWASATGWIGGLFS